MKYMFSDMWLQNIYTNDTCKVWFVKLIYPYQFFKEDSYRMKIFTNNVTRPNKTLIKGYCLTDDYMTLTTNHL